MTVRSRHIPEVIQTSKMDCGVACLTALLGGFGVNASYGRLREACQTDVDGTSIDKIEEVAVELGLDASQVLIPLDHVLLSEAGALPAITVKKLPGGDNHFVVIWRMHGTRVQIMDPAIGRHRLPGRRFLESLLIHEAELPAEMWRSWAESDELRRPLAKRLARIGVSDPEVLINRALVSPGWHAIAALDAATRMVQDMIDVGGLNAGASAAKLAQRLATSNDADAEIPDLYWFARAGSDDESLRVRGAVMIKVEGVKGNAPPPKSPELARALSEPHPQPWRVLAQAIRADGDWQIAALLLGIMIVAIGTVGEALLFRALFDVGRDLVTWRQLAGAVATLAAVLLALTVIEVPLRHGVARLGRHVEARLRIAFLVKLPRLGLPYLRSRPQSDMAERSHVLHELREMPTLAATIMRILLEIVATAVALCLIAPASWPWVVLLVVVVVVPPLFVQSALAEKDLRMRSHNGTVTQFYLDSLRGVVPVRTHGVERALRQEHESRLVDWVHAAAAELSLATLLTALQWITSLGVALALVLIHADRSGQPASVLLLAFWSLALPVAGFELTAALREWPSRRNLVLRMLEPLGAIDEEVGTVPSRIDAPISLELRDITIIAGGHPVIQNVNLTIRAGEHVAIVGRSGAGKSTLLALLLGWIRPASGQLLIDGVPVDHGTLAALRRHIAWLDPSVHLWNTSLASNLAYAQPGADISSAIGPADLEPLIARLPEGLGTQLGEGGALVSGGEGQRIRFGRALAGAQRPPALALLDEPFRGLDRSQRRARLVIARERWRASTLLCATHDLDETLTFPRVLVVDGGSIVEDGDPSVLAMDPTSRLAALLAEERGAHAAWRKWRRLTLSRGHIVNTVDP